MALDPAAVKAANAALWAAHPELNGRQLTSSPADAQLRAEWLKDYHSASEPSVASTQQKSVCAATLPCQAEALHQVIGPVSDALDALQRATAAQTSEEALDDGLTPETAEAAGKSAADDLAPIGDSLGLFSAGLDFVPAAEATGEVLGTDDYGAKVQAGSNAFAAMVGGFAAWLAGGAAIAAVAALVAATAPVWVTVGATVLAGAVAGYVGYKVGSWAWNTFCDKPFQSYWNS